MSNIFLNTAINDGIMMTPFEFICVKEKQGKLNKSSCIISEFSGCAAALVGSYMVNPNDSEMIGNSISMAINSSAEDVYGRMERLYSFTKDHSAEKWAHNFLSLLKKSKLDQKDSEFIKMGFGLNWKMIKTRKGFKQIDFDKLEENYTKTNKRFILIEHEGVIPMKDSEDRSGKKS